MVRTIADTGLRRRILKKIASLGVLLCVCSEVFGMNIRQEDIYKLERKKIVRQWTEKIVRMKMNNEDFKEVYGSDGSNILMDAVQNAESCVIRQILNLTGEDKNPVVDVNFKNNNGDTALLMAAREGSLEKLRILLSYGADVNVTNNKGESVLSTIVSSGGVSDNYEKLKLLFKYYINLDLLNPLEGTISKRKFKDIRNKLKDIMGEVNKARRHMKYAMLLDFPDCMDYLKNSWKESNAPLTVEGDTVLCFAITDACKDLIFRLINSRLELDLNLNLGNKIGMTPLLLATGRNYLDVVNCLIENGVNLDLKSVRGNTALMVASYANYVDIASSLIKHGANLNLQNNNGKTSLIEAVYEKRKDIVNLLVKAGANLDLQDNEKDSALAIASHTGCRDIVNLLVDNGANINVQNKYKMTPLMNALFMDYQCIASDLIEKGADLDVQNTYGLSAIMFSLLNVTLAAKLEKIKGWNIGGKHVLIKVYEQRLKNLVDKGANLNLCDKFGNTVLHYSLLMGCVDSANYLIDNGADLSISNTEGVTAIVAAIGLGNEDLIIKLLDKGADLKPQDLCEYTALSIAIEKRLTSIVKELLKRSDIDFVKYKDRSKRTALHIAIDKGYKDIVKLLLDKYGSISGSEMLEKDQLNMTIWDLAVKRGNIAIMEMLLQYLDDKALSKKLKEEVDDKKDIVNKAEIKVIKNYENQQIVQDNKEVNIETENVGYIETVNKAFITYALKGIIPDMEMLLEGDAKVTLDSAHEVLRTAAKTNNCKVIDSILMKVIGLNINDKDPKTGNTALMLASENGNYEAVADLVANGAFIGSENNIGDTALMLAAKNGHLEVVRYLCTVGVKQRDKNATLNYIDTEIFNKKRDKVRFKNESINRSIYEQIKEYLKDKSKKDQTTIELTNSDICRNRFVYFNSHSKKDWETCRNEGDFFERVQYLLQEIKKDPYKRGATLGKVEALTGNLEGLFSRRINDEHRLVYRVIDNDVYVVSCGGHYYKLRTVKDLFRDITGSFNKIWEKRELIDIKKK